MEHGRQRLLALLALLVVQASVVVPLGYGSVMAVYQPGLYESVLESGGGSSRIAKILMETALEKVFVGEEYKKALIAAAEGTFTSQNVAPLLKDIADSLEAYLAGSDTQAKIEVELVGLKRMFLLEFSKHYQSTDFLETLLDRLPSRLNLAEYVSPGTLSGMVKPYNRTKDGILASGFLGIVASLLMLIIASDHRKGIRWIGLSICVGGLSALALSLTLPEIMVDRAVKYLMEGGSQNLYSFFDLTAVKSAATAFVTRQVQSAAATALLLGALFVLLGWTDRREPLDSSGKPYGFSRTSRRVGAKPSPRR